MEFPNLEVFKQEVKDFNIELGKEVKWEKSDSQRVKAKFKSQGCPGEDYCAWSNLNKSFQLKGYNPIHTYSRQFKNGLASKKWVVDKLVAKIKFQPTLNGLQAYEYMLEEYNVQLNDALLYKAMKDARTVVEGGEKDQYAKLWD